ncbi:MAG: fructosamine kinase family protein [Bdellovibrionota bacterium]
MQQWVEDTLHENVIEVLPWAGGDTATHTMYATETQTVLIKTYTQSQLVEAELLGLDLIRQSNSFSTPKVLAFTEHAIMQEFIESGQPLEVYWRRFGLQLHKMHQNQSPTFGLEHSTYCGHFCQDNTPNSNWADFLWSCVYNHLLIKSTKVR